MVLQRTLAKDEDAGQQTFFPHQLSKRSRLKESLLASLRRAQWATVPCKI